MVFALAIIHSLASVCEVCDSPHLGEMAVFMEDKKVCKLAAVFFNARFLRSLGVPGLETIGAKRLKILLRASTEVGKNGMEPFGKEGTRFGTGIG